LIKTVILNSNEQSDFKAVLNLKENEKSVIKFFNLTKLEKNLALGIKQDKNIVKIPLLVCDGKSEFELEKNIDFKKNFLCAVVDVSNAFCPEILLSGSDNSTSQNATIEEAFVQTKPADASVLYEDETSDKIEKIIDKNLIEDMHGKYFDECAGCKYREAFYSGCERLSDEKIEQGQARAQSTKTQDDDKKEENDSENGDESGKNDEKKNDFNDSKNFFEQVKEQVEALFEKYEEDKSLQVAIPNSKWVKVTYDGTENYYVLGLIWEESGDLKYISYGVPSTDSNTPPEDLSEYAQWLPKDMENAQGEGYWIVCQDAKTGETLKMQLV
jgi:hypothetical protein